MTIRKSKPPTISLRPSPNMVIIERLKVDSKLDKEQKKKDPKVILSKEMIAKRNQEALESSKDILSVWEEHPLIGIVVAVGDKISEEYDIIVGDKIGFRMTEQTGQIIVFNKKLYIGFFGHEILFRYLTEQV
jgi:hypothetical protein